MKSYHVDRGHLWCLRVLWRQRLRGSTHHLGVLTALPQKAEVQIPGQTKRLRKALPLLSPVPACTAQQEGWRRSLAPIRRGGAFPTFPLQEREEIISVCPGIFFQYEIPFIDPSRAFPLLGATLPTFHYGGTPVALGGLGGEVGWVERCFRERARHRPWRSRSDPPALLSRPQGLAEESRLVLTQPRGVIHRLLIKRFSSSCLQMSALNSTSEKPPPSALRGQRSPVASGAAVAGRQRGGSEQTGWRRGSVLAPSCRGAGPGGLPVPAWEAVGPETGFWGAAEVSNAHSSSSFEQKQQWELLLCEAPALTPELPALAGAGAFSRLSGLRAPRPRALPSAASLKR